MSTELWQLFSAEYLLLCTHTSNDCTGFCFPQTCNFNIGLFLTFQLLLTFQLSKISLMLRLSRAFPEYFHTLRKGISIWSCFCLMVTGYLLHWKSGKFLIQMAIEIPTICCIIMLKIFLYLILTFFSEKSQTCCLL